MLLISGLRFEVTVRTKAATAWVPADHLVVTRTLSDPLFLSAMREKLPQKANLSEFKVISTFVSVEEVNGGGGGGGEEESKEEASPLIKKGKGRAGAVSSKAKPSFSEAHMLVTWSDGSYATVGNSCGRLTRYCDIHHRQLIDMTDTVILSPVPFTCTAGTVLSLFYHCCCCCCCLNPVSVQYSVTLLSTARKAPHIVPGPSPSPSSSPIIVTPSSLLSTLPTPLLFPPCHLQMV